MIRRWFYYILGLNFIAFAVVLYIRYDLGVAAFSSVMYAIAEIYGISMGTASILCYLILVAVQCLLVRRVTVEFVLEIPLSFAFGLLIDLYDFLIPVIDGGFAVRLTLYCLTLFVTALGVFLCVKTDLVLTPVDGIVKTISEVFRLRFSLVKNGFDISLVLVTAVLCLVNHTPFYGIGIGTVISAICLGRIIKIYETHLFVNASLA